MTRGIVTICDHEKYHGSLYVLVRLLKHWGCKLPIQAWTEEVTLDLEGVEWRFYNKEFIKEKSKHPQAWVNKPYSVLASGFDEVLFLDADCFPTRDPEVVFDWKEYKERGALFAQSPWYRKPPKSTWEAYGLEHSPVGGLENCAFYIDMNKRRKEIEHADAMAFDLDKGHLVCGDHVWFLMAFRENKNSFPPGIPKPHSIIHPDFDGEPLFVHRHADKFRIKGWKYPTDQLNVEVIRDPDLPNEDLCFDFFADYARNVINYKAKVPGFTSHHPINKHLIEN